MAKVIGLLTDFGTRDYFVASMKGVILSIDPSAVIVDISHDVPSFNVRRGAFILWATYRYFPRGSIFVAVVDPGVGTARRAIAIRGRNYYFIGPDNGVLTMAALDDGIVEVREIRNPRVMLGEVSQTFHGRDIFAPAAASIGLIPFEDYGPVVEDYVKLQLPRPRIVGNVAETEVVYIDKFGNAYTGVRNVDGFVNYGDEVEVRVKGRAYRVRVVKSYGYVNRGELALLFNSMGFLELSINQGNLAEELGLVEGDEVALVKLTHAHPH